MRDLHREGVTLPQVRGGLSGDHRSDDSGPMLQKRILTYFFPPPATFKEPGQDLSGRLKVLALDHVRS